MATRQQIHPPHLSPSPPAHVFGEAFLRNPAQVEIGAMRSASAEPRGDFQLTFEIAGSQYRFEGLDSSQARTLASLYADFRCHELASRELVVTRLEQAPEHEFQSPDLRGWEYWIDFRYREDHVHLAGLGLAAHLDWSSGRLVGTLWTCEQAGFANVFENYLRVLLAYRLLEQGGALIHSAGLLDGERGLLFPGVSGAGKSTLSMLGVTEGLELLSDDLNALCPHPGAGCALAQLPFHGDLHPTTPPTRRVAPLTGLFQLAKGTGNQLTSLGSAAALALLIRCSPYVNNDPLRNPRLVDNLAALLDSVPTQVLTFDRHGGFRNLLPQRT